MACQRNVINQYRVNFQNWCHQRMNDSATTRLVLLLSQLSEFVSANYTSGNMSIVGVGVGQEELLQLVKKYFNKGARPGKGPAIEKAAFHSGEWITSLVADWSIFSTVKE